MICTVCHEEASHLIVTLKTMTARGYCVGCMREKLGGGDAKRTGKASDVAPTGGARRAAEAGGGATPADGDAGDVGDEERQDVAPRHVQEETATFADGEAVPGVQCQAAGCVAELTHEQVNALVAIGQPLLCVDHQLAASRAAKAAKKKPTAEPYGRGATG